MNTTHIIELALIYSMVIATLLLHIVQEKNDKTYRLAI